MISNELAAVMNTLDKIPTTSDTRDLAAALQVITELEKIVRKKKVSWMASLVLAANQPDLPAIAGAPPKALKGA